MLLRETEEVVSLFSCLKPTGQILTTLRIRRFSDQSSDLYKYNVGTMSGRLLYVTAIFIQFLFSFSLLQHVH